MRRRAGPACTERRPVIHIVGTTPSCLVTSLSAYSVSDSHPPGSRLNDQVRVQPARATSTSPDPQRPLRPEDQGACPFFYPVPGLRSSRKALAFYPLRQACRVDRLPAPTVLSLLDQNSIAAPASLETNGPPATPILRQVGEKIKSSFRGPFPRRSRLRHGAGLGRCRAPGDTPPVGHACSVTQFIPCKPSCQ